MSDETKTYTVVCAYRPAVNAIPEIRLNSPARVFYDTGEFRSAEHAAAIIGAKCPTEPEDVLVFEGRLTEA